MPYTEASTYLWDIHGHPSTTRPSRLPAQPLPARRDMLEFNAMIEQDLWILVRIAAAMLLGGVLGLEREMGRHAAGLRTHMMISGAAALIVGLGDVIAQHFSQEQYRELLRVDPVRLIEAVVAAVGFVGAGAILRSDKSDRVHGLTTASSLLMAAAIGIAAGLGNYLLALGASLMCVVVLALFRRFERVVPPASDVGKDKPTAPRDNTA